MNVADLMLLLKQYDPTDEVVCYTPSGSIRGPVTHTMKSVYNVQEEDKKKVFIEFEVDM